MHFMAKQLFSCSQYLFIETIAMSEIQSESNQNWIGVSRAWGKLAFLLVVPTGVAAYFIFFQNLKVDEYFNAFGNFPYRISALILALVLAQVFFQTLRLFFVTSGFHSINFSSSFRIYCIGQIGNSFLPGRMGDLYKSLALSRDKQRKKSSSITKIGGSIFIVDKIVDLVALLILLFYFHSAKNAEFSVFFANIDLSGSVKWVGGIIILILIALFASRLFLGSISVKKFLVDMLQGFSSLSSFPKNLGIFVCGLAAWICEAYIFVSLSSSFDWKVGISDAFRVLAILNLGVALPLSLANLGIYEASVVFALSQWNIPLTEALALASWHHLAQLSGPLFILLLLSCIKVLKSIRKHRHFRVTEKDKLRIIQHYSNIAMDYERKVTRGVLLYLRKRERAAILRCANFGAVQTDQVIDVGCGSGFYALKAKHAGHQVSAVDVSPNMVNSLIGHVDEVLVGDIESFEIKSQYDIVICAGVLDFVISPARAFQRLSSLVKPGGRLVVQAPRVGIGGLFYRLEKMILGVRVNLYTLEWFKKQAHECDLEVSEVYYPLLTNQVICFQKLAKS